MRTELVTKSWNLNGNLNGLKRVSLDMVPGGASCESQAILKSAVLQITSDIQGVMDGLREVQDELMTSCVAPPREIELPFRVAEKQAILSGEDDDPEKGFPLLSVILSGGLQGRKVNPKPSPPQVFLPVVSLSPPPSIYASREV